MSQTTQTDLKGLTLFNRIQDLKSLVYEAMFLSAVTK